MNFKVGSTPVPPTAAPAPAAKPVIGGSKLNSGTFPYANTTQNEVPTTAGGLVMAPNNVTQAPANASQVGSTQINVPGTTEAALPGATKVGSTVIKLADAATDARNRARQEAAIEEVRQRYLADQQTKGITFDENGEPVTSGSDTGLLSGVGDLWYRGKAWAKDTNAFDEKMLGNERYSNLLKQVNANRSREATTQTKNELGIAAYNKLTTPQAISEAEAAARNGDQGAQLAIDRLRSDQGLRPMYQNNVGSQGRAGGASGGWGPPQGGSSGRWGGSTGRWGGRVTQGMQTAANLASPTGQAMGVGASGIPAGFYSAQQAAAAMNPWVGQQFFGGGVRNKLQVPEWNKSKGTASAPGKPAPATGEQPNPSTALKPPAPPTSQETAQASTKRAADELTVTDQLPKPQEPKKQSAAGAVPGKTPVPVQPPKEVPQTTEETEIKPYRAVEPRTYN